MKDYTSSQVAKLCHATAATVRYWAKHNMIEHYRVPNSNHRRFTKEAILRFIKHYDLPMPDEFKVKFIPKGSAVFDGHKFLAFTAVRFDFGYVPKSEDYTPPIATGTEVKDFQIYHDGKLIYTHKDGFV